MSDVGEKAAARAALFGQLESRPSFDVVVIGGGATGVGVALEATARGFRTLLLEAADLAKGTSSRATKLLHGGVRYLGQGQFGLVREALRERTTLFANAPHVAQPLSFVVPAYSSSELARYTAGLKLYDWMAGPASAGPTRLLRTRDFGGSVANLSRQQLRGAVRYWDGQFDDARLALLVARTAAAMGSLVINYCRVERLLHDGDGRVAGLACTDTETGRRYEVQAACVVNATGVWVDSVRGLDAREPAASTVRPSQGAHIVVDQSFWPNTEALLIPKTRDGRVVFAVPWLGSTLIGTTDTARQDAPPEPLPYGHEIDLILDEVGRYLHKAPQRRDIRSAWAGLRPLAHDARAAHRATSAVSREHTIHVGDSKLVTVTGGKWTTYRSTAQHVIEHCMRSRLLPHRPGSTRGLRLLGHVPTGTPLWQGPGYHSYGSEAPQVLALPGAGRVLGRGLTEAMVRFAARHEYARTVEDVLARRSRLLFLDAWAAAGCAAAVAAILQEETGRDPELPAFLDLAAHYANVHRGAA
ncbi:glycerol-3-phosphate dehydrogenase/oxidase [Ramlibacter sp. AN1133]|uniref:glycerol-3-phosphate dehydrogenase/oxidase n=1 Tax=Ramlibacter sp. AN1133 TaxID=3133429 RepID=UPI0030C28FB6